MERLRRMVAVLVVQLIAANSFAAGGPAGARACDHWFAARAPGEPAAFHSPAPGAGCFDGRFTEQGIRQLFAWLQLAQPAPSQLTIRSPGGDVKAALQIGRQVLNARVKVYARDLCASSCANYVFMVGREPETLPGSLVLYHGGMSPAVIVEAGTAVRNQIGAAAPAVVNREVMRVTHDFERQLADQRQLYADAGLPPNFLEQFDLLSWDALPAKDCTPGATLKESGFITLTLEQYRRLGAHPVGELVERPERVHELLTASGRPDVAVCFAPAAMFQ